MQSSPVEGNCCILCIFWVDIYIFVGRQSAAFAHPTKLLLSDRLPCTRTHATAADLVASKAEGEPNAELHILSGPLVLSVTLQA